MLPRKERAFLARTIRRALRPLNLNRVHDYLTPLDGYGAYIDVNEQDVLCASFTHPSSIRVSIPVDQPLEDIVHAVCEFVYTQIMMQRLGGEIGPWIMKKS